MADTGQNSFSSGGAAVDGDPRLILDSLGEAILAVDRVGVVRWVNSACCRLLGCDDEDLLGRPCGAVLRSFAGEAAFEGAQWLQGFPACLAAEGCQSGSGSIRSRDGHSFSAEFECRSVRDHLGRVAGAAITIRDLTEREELEVDRLQRQRLDSVEQLSAGIAHEINTPCQYVSDNVRYLREVFSDLSVFVAQSQALMEEVEKGRDARGMAAKHRRFAQEIGADFLMSEGPRAVAQCLEGLGRISKIVSAMKAFAPRGQGEMVPADLNDAVESTVLVTRSQWSGVADVELELESEPMRLVCHPDELSQAMLNLVVNSAQAIADVNARTRRDKGRIRIATRLEERWLAIEIADDGGGIPLEARARVFDPFFTTKAVGSGTGQGLALARAAIVKRHGGRLDFEVEEGVGTTFTIRLPRPSRRGGEQPEGGAER